MNLIQFKCDPAKRRAHTVSYLRGEGEIRVARVRLCSKTDDLGPLALAHVQQWMQVVTEPQATAVWSDVRWKGDS